MGVGGVGVQCFHVRLGFLAASVGYVWGCVISFAGLRYGGGEF